MTHPVGGSGHLNERASVDTDLFHFRFRMPLLLFTGIDRVGKSFLVASALMSNETKQAYDSVLRMFVSVVGCVHKMHVVITDNNRELGEALIDHLPGVFHQLCCWHMSKRVLENLKKSEKLGTDVEFLMSRVESMIWAHSEEQFDDAWQQFSNKCSEASAGYMNHWLQCKTKWSTAWTRHRKNFAVHTTQRSESQNRAVKANLEHSGMCTTECKCMTLPVPTHAHERRCVHGHQLIVFCARWIIDEFDSRN